MPRARHSEAQRLRSQLAVSQGEVRALEHKFAQLTVDSVSAAQEHAAAERLLLERLTIADVRCQEAVQRAEAAEVKVLQYIEAEQRTGLMDGALHELRGMFPEAAEIGGRAELAVAEAEAWEKLAIVHAAHRREVKRVRKNLRKKRQKERKRKQERRNHEKPTSQGDGGSISSSPDEFTTARSVASTASDSASSTRIPSNEALFVDNVGFWIAAFVPYAWAPVNSKSVRMVFKVMNITKQVWKMMRGRMGRLQTMGVHYPPDNEAIGPGVGVIYSGYLAIQTLRNDVFRLARADRNSITGDFATRWLLHMDRLLNMYEALRLGVKELYIAAMKVLFVSYRTRQNIQEALEIYGRRKQTGNEPDGDVVAEADSAA